LVGELVTTKVYTVYSWTVKPGFNQQFLRAWRSFAKSILQQPGSNGSTRLFRDLENPAHFLSVDSWQDEKAMKKAGQTKELTQQMEGLRKLLDEFSSWSLKPETEQKRSK